MHLARVSFKYLKYYQGLLCAENHVQGMTIGIKATEQVVLVVLFNMLYKVALTLESVDEILKCDHSNESLIEKYFPVVLFIMLYKVVLTFESVDEILNCVHSNESY